MNRIQSAFNNRKAFISFITCGDPDLNATESFIQTMADSGTDLIELGIPFSDPTAEGPVIQEANLRALKNGITTDHVFEMVKRVRTKITIPMVFMTYANVVFSYGTDRFLKKAAEAGMDGIILPDVPYEEKEEFSAACRQNGLAFISLIAPTSGSRIEMIAKEAEGFVYCVSSLGVTGVRSQISRELQKTVAAAKSAANVPIAVGFGISKPEQAAEIASYSDGVIVGSAIVKLIAQYGNNANEPIRSFVSSMRTALDEVK